LVSFRRELALPGARHINGKNGKLLYDPSLKHESSVIETKSG
jgi:hypothetical protein